MTEDYWIIHLPTLLAAELMEIATADGCCLYAQQCVLLANLRDGKFTKLYGVGLLCVVNKTKHR